jgi:hypothetical protein
MWNFLICIFIFNKKVSEHCDICAENHKTLFRLCHVANKNITQVWLRGAKPLMSWGDMNWIDLTLVGGQCQAPFKMEVTISTFSVNWLWILKNILSQKIVDIPLILQSLDLWNVSTFLLQLKSCTHKIGNFIRKNVNLISNFWIFSLRTFYMERIASKVTAPWEPRMSLNDDGALLHSFSQTPSKLRLEE